MSAAVWLHDGPVGSGPGAVRLPAHKQCRLNPLPNGPGPWLDECPHGMGEAYIHERRVVSPVVDLPEGRLWHAVEQWYSTRSNRPIKGSGDSWAYLLSRGFAERRLVVVGYSDTQALTVTDENFWSAAVRDAVVGDVVLRWESVVMLDEPIASRPCEQWHMGCDECPSACDVPLAALLKPGWNPSVELETP